MDNGTSRVALVSMHTSPIAPPGSGDAGGMNVYLRALAGPLAAEGFEVDLLTRRTDSEQPAVVELEPGVRLRHLDAGPHDEVAKAELAGYADEFSASIADLGCYDLVHSHYWLSGVAGLAVANACGAPHLLSLHTVAAMKNANLSPGDSPEPQQRIAREHELVGASALTIAATEAEAAAIRRYYDADPDRVAVVSPGVDSEMFRPDGPGPTWLPEPLHTVAGTTGYLLMAARTQPLKGQDVAIRAVQLMDPATRPPLVLIGDASPGHQAYRDELEQLAAAPGLEGTVWFLPAQSRERLAELMRGASLLLVPSRSETYGLVTLEAAASGVPSVVSGVPGLTDAVADRVSGVHVRSEDDADMFDPQLWARRISELLADGEDLAALGTSARKYALDHDWRTVAATIAGRYRTLIAASAGGQPPRSGCSG